MDTSIRFEDLPSLGTERSLVVEGYGDLFGFPMH